MDTKKNKEIQKKVHIRLMKVAIIDNLLFLVAYLIEWF